MSFAKALIFAGIASQFVNAAPSAYNVIRPRDEMIQYETYCEGVTHYVAMTSTVYVDMPKATETPTPSPPQAIEQQKNASPSQAETHVEVQPVEEEKKEEEAPKAASMVQKKAVVTSRSGGEEIKGEATYYSPGLGSCGFTNSESDCVVALSHTVMSKFGPNPNANPMCGKMVDISCGDKSISAMVVDTCPGCANQGDVDVSPSCFEKLGNKDEGRLDVMVKLPVV